MKGLDRYGRILTTIGGIYSVDSYELAVVWIAVDADEVGASAAPFYPIVVKRCGWRWKNECDADVGDRRR
jgi:hypothetical protein